MMPKVYTTDQIEDIMDDCCKELNYEPHCFAVSISRSLFQYGNVKIRADIDGHETKIYFTDKCLEMHPNAIKKYFKSRIMEIAKEAKTHQLILKLSGLE